MSSCKHPDCIYRASVRDNYTLGENGGAWHCNYLSVTGHSRIAETVRRFGAGTSTDPAQCRLYEPGKRRTGPQRPAPLAGSRLPEQEEARRRKLYSQGLSDGQIAQALRLTSNGVATWRRKRGLPANPPPLLPDRPPEPEPQPKPEPLPEAAAPEPKPKPEPKRDRRCLPPEEEARRRELYGQGLSDGQIAQALGHACQTIFNWRQRRGLPSRRKLHDPVDGAAIMRLYRQGLTDKAIAARLGVNHYSVGRWRRLRGLPGKRGPKLGKEGS